MAFSALPLTVSTTSVTFAWPLENSGMRCEKLNFEEVFFSNSPPGRAQGVENTCGICDLGSPELEFSFQ